MCRLTGHIYFAITPDGLATPDTKVTQESMIPLNKLETLPRGSCRKKTWQATWELSLEIFYTLALRSTSFNILVQLEGHHTNCFHGIVISDIFWLK